MKKGLALFGFLLVAVGGGLLIGYTFLPGSWYQGLTKPAFTPPNWLFAPAWTTLYVLIAIVGWRRWLAMGKEGGIALWVGQMILNFFWSPTVFGGHNLLVGLMIIGLLWLSIAAFIGKCWWRDRVSALLFVPYLAWVSFAAYLNAGLLLLN